MAVEEMNNYLRTVRLLTSAVIHRHIKLEKILLLTGESKNDLIFQIINKPFNIINNEDSSDEEAEHTPVNLVLRMR